jgi:H+/gluconate symporter-like permease
VPEDPALAVFLGVATATAVFRRQLVDAWRPVGEGFVNGLLAIGATASIVGFGAAVKELPAFRQIVAAITSIPGDPLVGAAVAVAVIALISGSASGGQAIALPILKPIYIDQLGVAPRALHRVVSIASGSLDSLPANGYIVMLIRTICGETHARAYGPIFVLTVVIPALGTALAILLFAWFPKFGSM